MNPMGARPRVGSTGSPSVSSVSAWMGGWWKASSPPMESVKRSSVIKKVIRGKGQGAQEEA
jgi:hypothetical protein